MLQLIYELRKIVADGWTGRNIEGSTRGRRGPKKEFKLVNSILLFHFFSWTLYLYFIKCMFSIVSSSGGLLPAHKLVHRAVEAEGSGKLHEGRGRYEVLREARYHEEDGDGNEDDGGGLSQS